MPVNDWGVSLPPNAAYVRDVLKLKNAVAAEPPNDQPFVVRIGDRRKRRWPAGRVAEN